MPIRIVHLTLVILIVSIALGLAEAKADDNAQSSEDAARAAAQEAMNRALGIESPAKQKAPAPPPPPSPQATPADATAKDPNAPPAPPAEIPLSQRPEQIEILLNYYVDMFDKHLKEPDWMARVMGVISLSKIDDPRMTHRLLRVMRTDKEPIVRIYAWEALHGRHTSLDEENRLIWARIGFDLFEKNLLRGDLRIGVIGLIEEGGPTTQNKERLMRIFATTNSINPSDIRTLWAIGDVIKRWQSGDMVRRLITAMGKLETAYRAELVLRRLNDKLDYHTKHRYESSDTMWQRTAKVWVDWFQEQNFQEVAISEVPPYTGLSKIMPNGERITDTADPRWRKDLELKRFRLDQLDVCIVLDTTASMGGPLEWVKKGVVKMMRTFELISREPRIGVTLYRDHGDAYVTKVLPLSPRADILAKLLAPEGPKGGGDIPEAVLEALAAAVRGQRWSPSSAAKKIIVIITDAPAHENSVEDVQKFVRQEVDNGFQFHAIKVRTSKYVERTLNLPNWDPNLTSIDKLAAAANGQSLWVQFWTQSVTNPRWCGTASPTEGNTAERAIFRQVMRAALEDNYHDRVDPFIGVLLEYVEEPVPEERLPFPKATPGKPSKPSNPQMNR